MTTAFVLGNGISRQGIDLDQLRHHGPIFGCNALYREFTPDVLVATDRPIATAIQESGYAKNHRFYTRRPLENFGANTVPKPYFGFSSGPIAVAMAAQDGHDKIYLLGFDMGPTAQNQFNNIYADTEFYKPQTAMPTYTGNWIRQLTRIAEDYSRCTFVRIHGPTTADIAQFDKITNIQRGSLQDFMAEFF